MASEDCNLLKILQQFYHRLCLLSTEIIDLLKIVVVCKELRVHTNHNWGTLIHYRQVLCKPSELSIIYIHLVVTTTNNTLCNLLTLFNLIFIDNIIEHYKVNTALIHRVECRTKDIAKTLNSIVIRVICSRHRWIVVVIAVHAVEWHREVMVCQMLRNALNIHSCCVPEAIPSNIAQCDSKLITICICSSAID